MKSRTIAAGPGGADSPVRWKDRLAYLVVCGLICALYLAGGLGFADRKLDEAKFALAPRPATGSVVLVEIDARSVAALGVWPWPRRLHAAVLDRLIQAGATRVAFDVDFSAASSPDDDARLAAALKRAAGKAVLPVFTQPASERAAEAHFVHTKPLPQFQPLVQLAALNVFPSTDGLVRELSAWKEIDGEIYPTLAQLLAGGRRAQAVFAIDFGIDPATVPRLSFMDVLEGRFERAAVAGKQVVIGSTAAELGDQFAVPVHVSLPGPLLHILGYESIVQDRALQAVAPLPILLLVAMLLVLLRQALERLTLPQGLCVVGACGAGITVVSVLLQRALPIQLDTVPLLLAVVLSPVPAMLNRLDRQSMRLLFQSLDIRRKNMLMRNLIEKSIVGVVISREDGRIESVNEAAASMFGYSAAELRGASVGGLVPEFRAGDAAEAPLRRLTAEGHKECTGVRADGTRFPIDLAVSEVADEQGSRYVSFVNDITLRKEQEQRLQHQAEHDALTGLPNRVKLSRGLAAEIEASGKDGRKIAVYMLDLDGFKNVNDTLGHAVGDRLLQDISAKLGGLVPRGATLARFGGDEFVFFVPGTEGSAEAEAFARYVLQRLKQPIRVDSIDLEVGGSIGAAIFPDDGGTPDELIQHADIAMYAAKRDRTGYERYWAEGDIHGVRNLTLTGDLRRAIENGELELAFQPKIDLATSAVTGVEALCRWKRGDHGFVPPDEFIGHAEQSGLIMPLTEWALDKAVETGALWRECGRDLSVAVNLSAHLLHRESTYDAVVAALDKWRYPANRLTLEVTETGLLVSPEKALQLVGRFSALGIKVSIDDFGTGYSSLSYLATLRAHELKIDKSFVFGMLEDAKNATIVRSVISMAHDLGLRVVAEGIETMEITEALRANGCDIGQGYLFGKPMVFADFETWYGLSEWSGGKAAPAVA